MRKQNNKTQLIILGTMIVLLVCCGQSKKQRLLFLEKAKGLGGIIITQASGDLSLCKMYNTVWEYAKVTDLDFPSAYREMMLDTSQIRMQMETNMQMMDQLMNMVKNPPKSMTGIHDKLIELRESYQEFNRFVYEPPQVSQEEFNADVDNYITHINLLKDDLDRLIAEAEANL